MLQIQNLKIKNYMEDLVMQDVNKMLEGQQEICKCEQCRSDIIALALNFLPARYAVSDVGGTYTKIQMLDYQARANIFAAISKAAAIVNANPRHDK